MKRVVLFALLFFSVGELCAALPPFIQSRREIEAILSNQEIYQYIPNSDVIHQIVKTPTGYMIITNNRILPVSIRYVSRKSLGPARFAIRFHKAIETGSNTPGEDESQEDIVSQNDYSEEP